MLLFGYAIDVVIVTPLRSHRHQLTKIHLSGSRQVRSCRLVKRKAWIAVVREYAVFGTTNNIRAMKERKHQRCVYP